MNPKAEKSDQKEANEKLEILQILIRSKDINLNLADVYHRTLLHYACEGDYFFSIMYLLDSNMNSMNSEAKDIDDNTPLAVCLKNNKIDQAMLLIKKGVLVGYVNDGKERQSYFTWALKQCSVGLCFLLLDNGYPLDKAL